MGGGEGFDFCGIVSGLEVWGVQDGWKWLDGFGGGWMGLGLGFGV